MIGKLAALSAALLAATGAAHAQFGDFGEKLFDRAKDEVENALAAEPEDPQKDDASDAQEQPEANGAAAKETTDTVVLKAETKSAQAAGELAPPRDEMSWRVDAGPAPGMAEIGVAFFNPQRLRNFAPGEIVLTLKRRRADANFEGSFGLADRAFNGPPGGGARLMVDGETYAEGRWDQYGAPINFDAARLVEAMKTGEIFSVEFQAGGGAYKVVLPLAGFAPKLEQGLRPPSPNAYRAKSVTNQCVQRNGGFSYACYCLGEEYVKALDAAAANGQAAPPDFASLEAACSANVADNGLLSSLTHQELLFGAEFNEAGPEDMAGAAPVEGAVKIGRILTPGPAAEAGLRSGEILVAMGSNPPLNRLTGERAVSLEHEQSFDVYSPRTQTTRRIRITPAIPNAGVRAETMAMFGAPAADNQASGTKAAGAPEAPAEHSAAETKTTAQPAPQKVGYADPAGEQCAAQMNGFYDCACIDARAPQIRLEISERKFAEAKKMIPYRENQLRLLQENLAQETDPQRIAKLEQDAALRRNEIETLKKRPDPMSIDAAAVVRDAYRSPACKIGHSVRETETKNCLASASLLSVSDPQSYCACSADKAAELWLQSGDQQYRSSVITQIVTRARQICRTSN